MDEGYLLGEPRMLPRCAVTWQMRYVQVACVTFIQLQNSGSYQATSQEYPLPPKTGLHSHENLQ